MTPTGVNASEVKEKLDRAAQLVVDQGVSDAHYIRGGFESR
jgi:hypothetical protein